MYFVYSVLFVVDLFLKENYLSGMPLPGSVGDQCYSFRQKSCDGFEVSLILNDET